MKGKKMVKRSRMGKSGKKKDIALASMSVDDFFSRGLESESEDTEKEELEHQEGNIEDEDKGGVQASADTDSERDSNGEMESEDDAGDVKDFNKSLAKLKDVDPEFYKFLQANDSQLLQMAEEDGESEGDNGEMRADGDASGEEEEEEPSRPGQLSIKKIRNWEAALSGDKPKAALKEVTMEFRCAVERSIGQAAGEQNHMENPAVFNALMRLCLNCVPRAVSGILKLESAERDPTKCKQWPQVQGPVKRFLADVVKLLCGVSSSAMQRALLRHLLAMVPYVAAQPRLCKSLCRRLVALWSTGEEEVRVLAFVNLYRLAQRCPAELDTILTKAYLAYVKNCAFTSPSSWPQIHLMRRSLVELFSIDPALSYQRAFLYIRQLAIHLRNAKLDKQKFQVVYNWQYVHCLLLWSALLSENRNEELRLLLYPLVQIMLGAANLITTSRHYPLRFHITRALTSLSGATGTFIPVLPVLLQVLHQTDFNKRNKRVSMRPLDLSCMLRFSESELKENGFRDGVFDSLYSGLLDYLHVECCSLAFPELVVMARIQLKEFVSKCKVRSYNQRIKELLDKVKSQCDHLETKRKTLPFELSDVEAVRRWEQERRSEGTPLSEFYSAWQTKQQQQARNKPDKDGKISVSEAARSDSADSDGASDEDEVCPLADSDQEDGSDQLAPDQGIMQGSELEEGGDVSLEDEGDTLEPLVMPEKKQKKVKTKAVAGKSKKRRQPSTGRPNKRKKVR